MSLTKLDVNIYPQKVNTLFSNEYQQLMQILKRHLHQNNLSLYCSQNQNNQTLLDVIADYFSVKRQELHALISARFKEMLEQETLPKKLAYVYSDTDIIQEYSSDPELVSFYKITYELVCAVYQVKIVIYTLIQRSDKDYVLNAMIVNPKGVQRQVQLARIGNSFYRVQEQFHQQDQFSVPSLQSFQSAKSSNNLNSEEKQEKEFRKMRQPFQSEKIIVDIDVSQLNDKRRKLSPEYPSSQGMINEDQLGIHKLALKKGRSVNFKDADYIKNQSEMSQYDDDVSLGNILDKQQEKQLLSKCSNIGKQSVQSCQRANIVHHNNHISSNMVSPTDMMYYYFMAQQQGGYTSQGYPGKSQPYLPYAGHSVSPTKNPHKFVGLHINNSPVKSTQPFSPIYPSQQSQDSILPIQTSSVPPVQLPSLPPLQIKQGQRYTGRLKFFDEGKNYGFIILDADESDLFVHFDDLQKAGINKEKLKAYKQSQGYLQVKFSFKVMQYFGKYRQSRKAVELIVMEEP